MFWVKTCQHYKNHSKKRKKKKIWAIAKISLPWIYGMTLMSCESESWVVFNIVYFKMFTISLWSTERDISKVSHVFNFLRVFVCLCAWGGGGEGWMGTLRIFVGVSVCAPVCLSLGLYTCLCLPEYPSVCLPVQREPTSAHRFSRREVHMSSGDTRQSRSVAHVPQHQPRRNSDFCGWA